MNVLRIIVRCNMILTAIVEDDKDIREGIRRYIDSQSDMSCPIAAESVESFLYSLDSRNLPDVIIMDIGLPGMSGIEGIRIIKEKYFDVNIIVFTIYDDHDKIFKSLCAGASGYLLKNTPLPEIRAGIKLLYKGGAPMSPQIARKTIDFFTKNNKKPPGKSPLTDREKEIVIGLVDGLTYKLIADRMFISIETVRYHIKNIYQKLHVNCKAEVISKSLRGEI
jgi:DNA-binding NarL/FixJ family response regulator